MVIEFAITITILESQIMVNLSRVLITNQLALRKPRPYTEGSDEAFNVLHKKVQQGDESILQDICEYGLNLCNADASGLSVLGYVNDQQVFEWSKMAGNGPNFKVYSPRHDCPCGTVLDLYSYQIFRHPERHYTWVKETNFVIPEMISMPIYNDDLSPLGTLWLMHKEGWHFTREDVRIMTALTGFLRVTAKNGKFAARTPAISNLAI